jgi:hypothetical protein
MDWPYLADLEIIADWREDLSIRIARARLRHEIAGLHPDEIINLASEAREFKRVCENLKKVIGHA